MNREKYLEIRNALLDEIENLINEGLIEESEAKMTEVEELDNKWEKLKVANANAAALKDKNIGVEIENKSVDMKGEAVVDTLAEVKPVDVDRDKLYVIAWAKTMQGRKLEAAEQEVFNKVNVNFRNDGYVHTTGNTEILIPETVVAGIWKRAEEMYPLLGDVKKYNVRGNLTINKHTGIGAGDAQWYDEGIETADEKNIFGQLNLSGCELAKSVTVSWKLRAMATEDFIPFITNELGERVGVVLGKSVAVGAGKSANGDVADEPQGIETVLNDPNGSKSQVVEYKTTGTEDLLSYTKITEAIAKIHSSYLSGCVIYANNKTIWERLANLTDDVGRPLFIPDVTAGGVGRMFGMVVKPDAGISADSILIGHAERGYAMNTNEPMSIATQETIKPRQVIYGAYAIVDGGVVDEKAFALLKKSL